MPNQFSLNLIVVILDQLYARWQKLFTRIDIYKIKMRLKCLNIILEIYPFLILIHRWIVIEYNLNRYVIIDIYLWISFWHGMDWHLVIIIVMYIGSEADVQAQGDADLLVFHGLFVEFDILDQLRVDDPEHLAAGRQIPVHVVCAV